MRCKLVHVRTAPYSLFGLQQLVQQPTRVTPLSSTLIDHIYVNNLNKLKVSNVRLSGVGISDHCPILCTLSWRPPKRVKGEHTTIEYRSLKNFDQNAFLFDLGRIDFANVYSSIDLNCALASWYDTFVPIVNKHAPIRRRRVKHKTLPSWLTADIMEAMKIRDQLKRDKHIDQYKIQRNKISVMVKKLKASVFWAND